MLGEPTEEELAIICDLKAKIKLLEREILSKDLAAASFGKQLGELEKTIIILENHIEELEAELEEGNAIGLP